MLAIPLMMIISSLSMLLFITAFLFFFFLTLAVGILLFLFYLKIFSSPSPFIHPRGYLTLFFVCVRSLFLLLGHHLRLIIRGYFLPDQRAKYVVIAFLMNNWMLMVFWSLPQHGPRGRQERILTANRGGSYPRRDLLLSLDLKWSLRPL